jgi:hypothetical protein
MAPDERAWWAGQLSHVVEKVGIGSPIELEGVLRRVVWTDVFFGDVIRSVWAERRAHTATRDATRRVEFEKGRWKVDGWWV